MEKGLPNSWVECAISNVFDINPGHKNMDIDEDMEVTFLPMTLISEEQNRIETNDLRPYKNVKSGFTKFIEGDVLFANITPCMENGKLAIATNLKNRIGCGTTELHVFRSIAGTESKYLYYYLLQKDFRAYCKSQFNGAVGQQRVPKSVFEELIFPLPPLLEQQRIVTKLDTLFGHLDTLKIHLDRIPQLLKDFRQKVLTQAVTGKLTEEWREGRELGEWIELPLNEFSTSRLGKMLDKEKNQGIPTKYLRNINVRWFDFDLDDLFEIKVSVEEMNKYTIQNGDILVCEGGEPGRAAIWRNGNTNIIFQKAIHRVRLNTNVLPEYFLYNLKVDSVNNVLSSLFTGTTIKHLNGVAFSNYSINIPPLEEQQEIVSRVESLFAKADQIEASYQKLKTKIEQLPQALLAKAFRGELVEQLPTDGDARQLLEEIRKAKAGLEKGGRTKKMKENDEVRMVAEDGARYGKK